MKKIPKLAFFVFFLALTPAHALTKCGELMVLHDVESSVFADHSMCFTGDINSYINYFPPQFQYACVEYQEPSLNLVNVLEYCNLTEIKCDSDHYFVPDGGTWRDFGACEECPNGSKGSIDGQPHKNTSCLGDDGCPLGQMQSYFGTCEYPCNYDEFFCADTWQCSKCRTGFGSGNFEQHLNIWCSYCPEGYYFRTPSYTCEPCPEEGTTNYNSQLKYRPGIAECYKAGGGENKTGQFIYETPCYFKE